MVIRLFLLFARNDIKRADTQGDKVFVKHVLISNDLVKRVFKQGNF